MKYIFSITAAILTAFAFSACYTTFDTKTVEPVKLSQPDQKEDFVIDISMLRMTWLKKGTKLKAIQTKKLDAKLGFERVVMPNFDGTINTTFEKAARRLPGVNVLGYGDITNNGFKVTSFLDFYEIPSIWVAINTFLVGLLPVQFGVDTALMIEEYRAGRVVNTYFYTSRGNRLYWLPMLFVPPWGNQEKKALSEWQNKVLEEFIAQYSLRHGYTTRKPRRILKAPNGNKLKVLVLPFKNVTGDENYHYLGETFKAHLGSTLKNHFVFEQIHPEPELIKSLQRGEFDTRQITKTGKEYGADLVLWGQYRPNGDESLQLVVNASGQGLEGVIDQKTVRLDASMFVEVERVSKQVFEWMNRKMR